MKSGRRCRRPLPKATPISSEDRPSRRLEAERKPDGAGVARDRQPQSPAVSLGSWHLSGQQRYGHRHVLTRNEVPQTVVHPAAETAVRAALRCPAPVDGRLLDRRRVGAGGTEQDLHDGARLQPQAVDFEVLDRLAGHQRNRRVHQHDLLYRDPERLAEVGRSGGQPHPMLGMPEQGLNGESELVAGGLHAGELVRLIPPSFANFQSDRLSDDPRLWGGPVTDERYVILARKRARPTVSQAED